MNSPPSEMEPQEMLKHIHQGEKKENYVGNPNNGILFWNKKECVINPSKNINEC